MSSRAPSTAVCMLRALLFGAALAALPFPCVTRAGVARAPDAAVADEDRARPPARVVGVRCSSSAGGARISVALSRPAPFRVSELPQHRGRPRRAVIDVRHARLGEGIRRTVPGSLVGRVRAAQYDPDTVRVALDLAGSAGRVRVVRRERPPRLVVDVAPRSGRRAGGHPAAAAARPGATTRVRRVVVDAGHGGRDTGAIGPTGVLEKDVTLAIARRLARNLEKRGFRVVMTRRDDRYVPLPDRIALANARRGDVFVSVHANADAHADRTGVETFVAETSASRRVALVAARGDRVARSGLVRRRGRPLPGSRADAASRRLAELVQRETCVAARCRSGGVRDRGVKPAPYFVLVHARMPAVLVEASFISNRSGERRLARARFQERVAAGMARAVAAFGRAPSRTASRAPASTGRRSRTDVAPEPAARSARAERAPSLARPSRGG